MLSLLGGQFGPKLSIDIHIYAGAPLKFGRSIVANYALPITLVLLCFSFLHYQWGELKYSDPDQYYHYAVAKHFAATRDIYTLPQVKGLGWDRAFENKEFLFHVLLSAGYVMGGEAGVDLLIFLFSSGIVLLIFLICFEVTRSPRLSALMALLPLLSDTFLVRLLVIRPHVLAILIFLSMIWALLRKSRSSVAIAGLVFSLSYHALYIPVAALVVWHLAQRFYRNKDNLIWYGLGGLAFGALINPYFPSNIEIIWTVLNIVAAQFSPMELDYGKEVEPFRTDNFLFVFRNGFLALGLGISVLVLAFKNSPWLRHMDRETDAKYLFFGALSFLFFIVMLISPRTQEYFFPIVSIYAGFSLFYFIKTSQMTAVYCVLVLVGTLAVRPLANGTSLIASFKKFDASYLDLVKELPDTGFVFNCDWYGGHYVMYEREKMQVLDVLDPSLLRSYDKTIYEGITHLKKGRATDPFNLLNMLKADYVLCGSKVELHEQLLHDFRFQLMGRSGNIKETVYLFKVDTDNKVPFVANYEMRVGEEWRPVERDPLTKDSAYIVESRPQECRVLRPAASEKDKFTGADQMMFSGAGILSVFKDGKLYLNPTVLPAADRVMEILVPAGALGEWTFQLCPSKSSPKTAFAAFILTRENIAKLCPETQEPGAGGTYTFARGPCSGFLAR